MSGLLLVPLAGCPSDDPGQEGTDTSTTGDDTTSTTGDDTTSTGAVDSSSSDGAEESTTGSTTGDCHEERTLPDPPAVDCSGASTVIEGSIVVEEGQDDISALEGVIEVTGSIVINSQPITDLNALACVQRIGGTLQIFGSDQLTNVDGLYNLTELGGDFVFGSNNALEDFNGLPQLEQMDGSIVIRENASLRTISGFHSFVGLNGGGIDPETMEVIGGNLTIQENPVLADIDGFGEIRVVNGRVQITNNDSLCISSVICVVTGIVQPAEPQDNWSTANNNGGC